MRCREDFDFADWRAGNRDQRHIAMRQMNDRRVVVIGHERTAGTALLPARSQHEVHHDKLLAPREQIGERPFAIGGGEAIVLFDRLPRQCTARGADVVPRPGEGLFLFQQIFSRSDPVFVGQNCVRFHLRLLLSFRVPT